MWAVETGTSVTKNANSHIRKVEKPAMTIATVDAPGGIVTKSGKRISGKVIVADSIGGYGDRESLAVMAGDTVARVSTDSSAGDKAYEDAREQYDTDRAVENRKISNMSQFSKNPALTMYYTPSTDTWDLSWMAEDQATGFITPRSKKLTDAQAGFMYQQYQEAQLTKKIQKDE